MIVNSVSTILHLPIFFLSLFFLLSSFMKNNIKIKCDNTKRIQTKTKRKLSINCEGILKTKRKKTFHK